MSEKIVIVGAGLIGTTLSIGLVRRGYSVVLIEKCSHITKEPRSEQNRSINLVITAKGIKTLSDLNIWNRVKIITKPVIGRAIHKEKGETRYQAYGCHELDCNYSVSRGTLNRLLLDCALEEGVEIVFNCALESIDLEHSTALCHLGRKFPFDILIGSDGVGSSTRKELKKILNHDFQSTLTLLDVTYKELHMPSLRKDHYAIDERYLHIWPRKDHFLMALPNKSYDFTMTLYMSKSRMEKMKDERVIRSYFEKHYPEILPLMPDYYESFIDNPTGKLGTLECSPWCYRDKILLIGDAAHGILPFLGQGMNCGLEDVGTLLKNFDDREQNFSTLFQSYCKSRKKETDAIAKMSLENFNIIGGQVSDRKFLFKVEVEHLLEKTFPDLYRSQYGSIAYTLLPYSDISQAGVIQRKIIEQLIDKIDRIDLVDLDYAQKLIEDQLTPFCRQRQLSFTRYIAKSS